MHELRKQKYTSGITDVSLKTAKSHFLAKWLCKETVDKLIQEIQKPARLLRQKHEIHGWTAMWQSASVK